MARTPKIILSVVVAAGLAVSMAACSSGGSEPSEGGSNDTLVVETNFSLQSIDPARQFEFTGITIDQAIYQTALTFKDGDLKNPTDGLCSYEMTDDALVLTLTCEDQGAKFSNGDPVTVDDIVFSYQRLQGIQGNPSFYLDGVTVEKVDDETITLTSETANPALPFILPNSNLGVLNSKELIANGGAVDASDDAEMFLNSNSQGSGAYLVESFNAETSVVLKYNEHYNGPEPKFKRVVINNVAADTQLTDIQTGQANVVLDLSADQVANIAEGAAQVSSLPSTKSIYLYANENPDVSSITSNEDFRTAVRYALDYDKVLELAGEGAQRMASVIPNEFLGAVPVSDAPNRDLEKAAEYLEKAGYNGEAIPFHYGSDQAVNGVDLALLAESVQAQLKDAGIVLDLKPAAAATQLDSFRTGTQPMGIGKWGADFPDPTNYLAFAPGGTTSQRAGWEADNSPEVTALIDAAAKASGDERGAAYSDAFKLATTDGPFVPLVQPVQTVVISNGITKYVSNAAVAFDFALAE